MGIHSPFYPAFPDKKVSEKGGTSLHGPAGGALRARSAAAARSGDHSTVNRNRRPEVCRFFEVDRQTRRTFLHRTWRLGTSRGKAVQGKPGMVGGNFCGILYGTKKLSQNACRRGIFALIFHISGCRLRGCGGLVSAKLHASVRRRASPEDQRRVQKFSPGRTGSERQSVHFHGYRNGT